jgi:hypothetical protein
MARVSLGVYVLGAIDGEDWSTVDEHLDSCPGCMAELADLEALPALLATIDDDQIADLLRSEPLPAPSPGLADALVADVRTHRSRSRRQLALAAVAAVVALIAGPTIAVGVVDNDTPSPTDTFAQSISATDPQTGANATVSLASREWGTKVRLNMGDVSGGKICELRAIHSDGTSEVVASWRVRPQGYSGADKLTVEGSLATDTSDISRFDVVTTSGERLVEVTA